MLDAVLGGITSSIGSSLSGAIGGAIDDKWFGGGDPRTYTPEEMIKYSKDLQDTLYPGTTPFERLSAGGGGAAQGGITAGQASGQQNIEQQKMSLQKEIASQQAMTEIYKANRQAGAMERGQDITSGIIESPLIAQQIENMSDQERLLEAQALTEMDKQYKLWQEADSVKQDVIAKKAENVYNQYVARYPHLKFAKLYAGTSIREWGNIGSLIYMLEKRRSNQNQTGVSVPSGKDDFFSNYIDMGYRGPR